jgi:hypothetical protein
MWLWAETKESGLGPAVESDGAEPPGAKSGADVEPGFSNAMRSARQRKWQRAVRHQSSDEGNTNLTGVRVPRQDEIEPSEDELADDLGRVHHTDGTHVARISFEMTRLVTAEIWVVHAS